MKHESFVGRIVFGADRGVTIRPVNYLADDSGVVFCTAPGSILRAANSGRRLTFEVDASEPLDHSGWSVIAEGTAVEITDEEELAYLRRGPLRSWAVSPTQHWVRMTIDHVSGVRIPAH